MWRVQYRNFGTRETLVVNHTVDANGADRAGIRWYELRRPPAGAWTIAQQGTYAPDTVHRWMGSIAMDQEGNIALGYSVSSSTVFPGIRYASRLAGDPLGTLPQPEVTLMAGAGSQTHSSRRYGNYSAMSVDPTDDCTFWYTTEYYGATSPAAWRTRISSFKFPSCGVAGPLGRVGYVWANNPTAISYTPSPAYAYNSSGGPITISRSATGQYTIRFAGLGGNGLSGGHVQVTAYGTGPETCKVRSWSSNSTDFIVYVGCFNTAGNPVDTRYTVLILWPDAFALPTP
jgi:hypothetical protein